MKPPKPRLLIDFKAVMAIMVFFGAGTWGGCLLLARKVAWALVEPPMKAAVAEIVPRERARTDSLVRSALDSSAARSGRHYQRLEDLLLEMPGGLQAARRLQKRQAERRQLTGIPSQEIVIF